MKRRTLQDDIVNDIADCIRIIMSVKADRIKRRKCSKDIISACMLYGAQKAIVEYRTRRK